MKFYDIDQNSDEWIQIRVGKFTASTFGDLFMKPDTKTYQNAIIKVAYEKVTGESEESYSNKWMQRGHEREPLAREAYELLTFSTIEPGGFYEYNEFVGASPDGKIKGENGGVELKCPSFNVYHEYLETGKLPKSYYWQVHGQLLCTGWDFIDYMPFSSLKLKLITLRVYRDEKVLDELKSKLTGCIEEVQCLIKKIQS